MMGREQKTPVPKGKMAEWKIKRKQGDYLQISRISGFDRQTIEYAFKTGAATPSVFKAIDKYYKRKI